MASNVISVAITSQTGGLRSGLKGAQGALGSFDGAAKRTAIGLGTLAKGFVAFRAFSALAGSVGEANQSVKLQEQLLGQTNAVLKSTGGAANVTADGVLALSDAIEKKSLIDAEQIQLGQNVLLTFTNVRNEVGKGNDVFNQATQAAADMSTALGTDMKGSSILLGKALNDPIKGISALSRSGVSFTAQQKAQIKAMVEAGDTMGAQKLILGELSKEFSGSAAAAGDTYAGKVKHLKDIWDGFLETLIKKAVPVLVRIVDFMSAHLPGAIAKTQAAFQSVKGAISAVVGFFEQHSTAIKVTAIAITALFLPAMIQATVAFVAQLATTIALNAAWLVYGVTVKGISIVTRAVTGAQWLLNAALSANPIGLVIVGLVALGAALVLLWNKSDTFRSIVTGAFNAVKSAASAVVNFVTSNWKTIGKVILAATGPVGVAIGLIIKHFDRIKAGVSAVIGFFAELVSGIKGKISSAVSAVKALPDKITGVFTGAATLLKTVGGQIIDGLVQGIQDAAHKVTDAVKAIADKVKSGIKGALSIFSPSRVTRELGRYVSEGLALGITLGTPDVIDAVKRQGVKTKKELLQQSKDITKGLLAASRERLDALRAQRAEYAAAVTESARSFAALSNLQLGENESLSAGGVAQYLTDRLAAIRNFNAQLANLRARGVSDDLYNQIVTMGVEQGTGYAQAIGNASPAAIAQLNSLQAQITGASAALGANTAGALYNSGVQAAQGFHDGLQSSLDKIERAGLKISKALVKALKKALGIRSPSRVLKKIGRQSVAGLELGLDTKAISARGADLSRALVSGYSTPTLGAEFAAGHQAEAVLSAKAGSADTYNITVQLDAGMTVEQRGVEIQRSIDAAKRVGLVRA